MVLRLKAWESRSPPDLQNAWQIPKAETKAETKGRSTGPGLGSKVEHLAMANTSRGRPLVDMDLAAENRVIRHGGQKWANCVRTVKEKQAPKGLSSFMVSR